MGDDEKYSKRVIQRRAKVSKNSLAGLFVLVVLSFGFYITRGGKAAVPAIAPRDTAGVKSYAGEESQVDMAPDVQPADLAQEQGLAEVELLRTEVAEELQDAEEQEDLLTKDPEAPAIEPTGIYALTADNIDLESSSLGLFQGKVAILVNVASAWGYTDSNYRGLEQLYENYKDRGLVVLAFPCNQFGHQEPGSEAEIKEFVTRYPVQFPMFSKVDVNGPGAHAVYQTVKQAGGSFAADIEWNFVKFLIGREGQVLQRFPSAFDNNALTAAVEAALAA